MICHHMSTRAIVDGERIANSRANVSALTNPLNVNHVVVSRRIVGIPTDSH